MLVGPCDKQNWLIEIIDPMLLKEGINQEHFLAFAQTALSCISDTAEDRPTIIDAGKQLGEFGVCLTSLVYLSSILAD